jgi:hypothetical protein
LSRIRLCLALAIAALAVLAAAPAANAAVVTNGDFETGNLSGWQLSNSGAGSWFAYTGTSTPIEDFTVPAPPQGSYGGITDESGQGLHVLYQDVTLPPSGTTNQLSLFVYYDSKAPIVSPDSLDPFGGANQQYRIDVMKPSAPIDSVASGDVLLTVFRTLAGDSQALAPTLKTADLTSLTGQTVRLRLAEVDNQFFFNAGADAIMVSGLTVRKAKLNKDKGTAKLPITVTDPGTIKLTGKGVKQRSAPASKSVATQGGNLKLLVKPKGKTASKLNDSGRAKVKVTITYTPTGGAPITKKKKLTLKES